MKALKFSTKKSIEDYLQSFCQVASWLWWCLIRPDEQTFDNYFYRKLEPIQHNACLVITGAIKEMFKESLQRHRWLRKLCLFYTIFKSEHPKYLFNMIHVWSTSYPTRNTNNTPLLFSPSTITKWNKLDPVLPTVNSFSTFAGRILKQSPNSVSMVE